MVKVMKPDSQCYFVGEVLCNPFYNAVERKPMNVYPHSIYAGVCAASVLKGCLYLLKSIALLKDTYQDVVVSSVNSAYMNRHDFRHYLGSGEYEFRSEVAYHTAKIRFDPQSIVGDLRTVYEWVTWEEN